MADQLPTEKSPQQSTSHGDAMSGPTKDDDEPSAAEVKAVVTRAMSAAIDTFIGHVEQAAFSDMAADLRRHVMHHGVRKTFAHLQEALDRNAWPR